MPCHLRVQSSSVFQRRSNPRFTDRQWQYPSYQEVIGSNKVDPGGASHNLVHYYVICFCQESNKNLKTLTFGMRALFKNKGAKFSVDSYRSRFFIGVSQR